MPQMSVSMPIHCTITHFRFHARRMMALSVVYFLILHRLGRPHCVWDEYLYSVLQEVEVRVTVCVTVFCSVIVLCGMMMKGREKVKPSAGSQPALLKKHQGGRQAQCPHLMDKSLSTVQYAFSTYVLQKGLEFNSGL